jgi:serine/threonine protein kinase
MVSDVEQSMEEAAKALLREMLRRVKQILYREYRVTCARITPLGNGGSRLSIPCKVMGTKSKKPVRYFAKIIGSSDYVSSLSIQFMKNIYLHMNSKDPIFASPTSAEALARYQFDMLASLEKLEIPTPKPYGYHPIDEIRWLLVVEFVDAKPLQNSKVSPEIMDDAFKYLKIMHKNKLFHGDIKPDNIMLGDKLYIVDVGRFKDEADDKAKMAYDLVCLVCSFLGHFPPEQIITTALKHNTKADLRLAAGYIPLVQRRPDFYFIDETADKLRKLMND